MGVSWRTAVGARTRLSVKENGKKYLLEPAWAALVRECVGAWLAER